MTASGNAQNFLWNPSAVAGYNITTGSYGAQTAACNNAGPMSNLTSNVVSTRLATFSVNYTPTYNA